jgi:hypothetical protein
MGHADSDCFNALINFAAGVRFDRHRSDRLSAKGQFSALISAITCGEGRSKRARHAAASMPLINNKGTRQ